MNLKSKSIGALLGFTVAVSSALPAQAAMTRAPIPAPIIIETNVENVQQRRIRRNRSLRRSRRFRNRRFRRNRGGAIVGGVIAGAIIGSAIANSRERRRDRRSSNYNRHVNWCINRYRSYRESSDTYQPHRGRRRFCNSPFN